MKYYTVIMAYRDCSKGTGPSVWRVHIKPGRDLYVRATKAAIRQCAKANGWTVSEAEAAVNVEGVFMFEGHLYAIGETMNNTNKETR